MISVIVPAFNAEKTIERCIKSVFEENNDVECIVINDGSKDNTRNILCQLSYEYTNLIVVDIPNGGVSHARNLGLDRAKREWILFLDADDELVEGWFNIVAKKILCDDSDIILFEYLNEVPGEKLFVTKYSVQSGIETTKHEIYRLLLATPELNTCWGKVFRRELIVNMHIRFPNEIRFGEDAIFVQNICACTEKIVICHTPLVIYYYNPNSTMRSGIIEKRLDDGELLLENRLRCALRVGADDLIEDIYIHHFKTLTAMMIDVSKIPEKKARIESFDLLKHHHYTKRVMERVDVSKLGNLKKLEYILLNRFYIIAIAYFSFKGKFRKENTF